VVIALIAAVLYVLLTRFITSAPDGWDFTAWRGQLLCPGLFAFGFAMITLGIVRPERRSFLGWGIALAAAAIATSWLASLAAVRAITGAALTVGGAASTLTLWAQLRQWEAPRGGH
jgi:hypothetical protein